MPDFIRQLDEPLYPKILWNRPLNRRFGGRLLIIGGNKNGFNECQSIYQAAMSAGAGECELALPDSLERTMTALGIGQFVPSSPSGSLGKSALGSILELARDYDALIIAGNLTNNSETAVLIESLIDRLEMPIIFGHEVLQIMKFNIKKLSKRQNTLGVIDTADAVTLAGSLGVPVAISKDSLISKVNLAQSLAKNCACDLVITNGHIIVTGEKVVTTESSHEVPVQACLGAAATFWIQNQSKPTEGLATAAYVLSQAAKTDPETITQLSDRISKLLDQGF